MKNSKSEAIFVAKYSSFLVLDDDLWLPGPAVLQSCEVDLGDVTEEQRLVAGGVMVRADGVVVTWKNKMIKKIRACSSFRCY